MKKRQKRKRLKDARATNRGAKGKTVPEASDPSLLSIVGKGVGALALAGCAVTQPTVYLTHPPMEQDSDAKYVEEHGIGIGGNVWESKEDRVAVNVNGTYFESKVEDPVVDVNSTRMTAGVDIVLKTRASVRRLTPQQRVNVNGLHMANAEVVRAQERWASARRIYRESLNTIITLKRQLAEKTDDDAGGITALAKGIEASEKKAVGKFNAVLEASAALNEAKIRHGDFKVKVTAADLKGVRVPERPKIKRGLRGYWTIGAHYLDDKANVNYGSLYEEHKFSGMGIRTGLGLELGPLRAEAGVTYPIKENNKGERKFRFGGRLGVSF
jgi:hypothetical protein